MDKKYKIYFLIGIILVAALGRLLPHLANASAITALAIFAAAYLPARYAVGITLAARFISDLFLGFFSWPLMIAVYASHLVGILFGLWIKRSDEFSTKRWLKIFGSGIGAAAVFFLVTNFVMLYPGHYPQNIAGLIQSYVNGLPFLRGTLMGDLGYSIALFGAWQLAQYFVFEQRPQRTANPFFTK